MSKEDLIPYTSETAREAGKKNKRGRSLKTILNTLLEKEISLPEGKDKRSAAVRTLLKEAGYKKDKIAISDLIVMGDLIDAVKGNDRSRERIWAYKEGRPVQTTDVNLNERNKLPDGLSKEELQKLANLNAEQ